MLLLSCLGDMESLTSLLGKQTQTDKQKLIVCFKYASYYYLLYG